MTNDESATTADITHESLTRIELRQSNSSSCESSFVENNNQLQRALPRSKSQSFPSGGILRPPSYSSYSLPPTPSISFAPLPAIDERKRRVSGPLGVATRSRLLQQRKAMRMPAEIDTPPQHVWRDSEAEDEGDPLVAFGHFVKGASKGLWKRVSLKDIRALKDKTASNKLTEAPHAEEQDKEQRLAVDLDKGMKSTEINRVEVSEKNDDTDRTIPQDSATPPVQQQI